MTEDWENRVLRLGASRISKLTLNQEKRLWETLHDQFESGSEEIYRWPNGWAAYKLDGQGADAVGQVLRNCWQGSVDGAWYGDRATVTDEYGIPRLAFYILPPTSATMSLPMINQIRGRNNQDIRTEDHQLLEAMADDLGMYLAPNSVPREGSRTSRKQAALTRTQYLQMAQELDQQIGPDSSIVVYTFPNGWTVRELTTLGDVHREGELMGSCLSSNAGDCHPIWEYAWEALEEDEDEEWTEGDGLNFDEYIGEEGPMLSLRDTDNLPHLSWADNSILGKHNTDPKPEYQAMWDEFLNSKEGYDYPFRLSSRLGASRLNLWEEEQNGGDRLPDGDPCNNCGAPTYHMPGLLEKDDFFLCPECDHVSHKEDYFPMPREEIADDIEEYGWSRFFRGASRKISVPAPDNWQELVTPRAFNKEIPIKPRYGYHGTSLAKAQRILREGLKSWDSEDVDQVHGNPYEIDFFEPRPGHVYISLDPAIAMESTADLSLNDMGTEGGPALLRIDLSQLDPQKINPDEDGHPQAGEYDSWEQAVEDSQGDWQWDTLGQWAEQTGFGDDPSETVEQLNNYSSLAYQGIVPPSAIELMDIEDDGSVVFKEDEFGPHLAGWEWRGRGLTIGDEKIYGDAKEITPGELNELAKEAYTCGQCAYLALALHESTGGTLYAVVNPDWDDDGEEIPPDSIWDEKMGQFDEAHIPNHFGVEVNGMIVDIEGYHDFDEWGNQWEGYAVEVTPEQVYEWQKYYEAKGQWLEEKSHEEQMELARSFVDPVMNREAMAKTRKKKLEQLNELYREAPDTSEIIYQFEDGWSIRKPTTLGDVHRYGEQMGMCWSSKDDVYSSLDEWCDTYSDSEKFTGYDQLIENDMRALVDEDGIPHLAWFDDFDRVDVSTLAGTHNSYPNKEYVNRLVQHYGPDTTVDLAEGANDFWYPQGERTLKRFVDDWQDPWNGWTE